MEDYSKILVGLRAKMNCNQRELAQKIGISQRSVSDIENGRTNISKKTAAQIDLFLAGLNQAGEMPTINFDLVDNTAEGGGKTIQESVITIKGDYPAMPAILKKMQEEGMSEDTAINNFGLAPDFFTSFREGGDIDIEGYNTLFKALNISYDGFSGSKKLPTTLYRDKSGKITRRTEGNVRAKLDEIKPEPPDGRQGQNKGDESPADTDLSTSLSIIREQQANLREINVWLREAFSREQDNTKAAINEMEAQRVSFDKKWADLPMFADYDEAKANTESKKRPFVTA